MRHCLLDVDIGAALGLFDTSLGAEGLLHLRLGLGVAGVQLGEGLLSKVLLLTLLYKVCGVEVVGLVHSEAANVHIHV